MAAPEGRPMIYRLIYISDICEGYSKDLNKALDGARSFYAEHNITGALWFDGLHFIQLLEGPEKELKDVVEQRLLPSKPRCNVRVSDLQPAEKRLFPDWTMSYLCKGSPAHKIACQFTGNRTFDPHNCPDEELLELLCTLESARQERARRAIN